MNIYLMRVSVLLALLSFGVSGAASAGDDNGKTGFYIEIGGSSSSPSGIDAPFTSTLGTNVNWDTSGAFGTKIKLGWDFGKFRTDLKISAHDGGVDSIAGVAATRDDFWVGSGTINGYWDILDKKIGKRMTLTPYIGAGLGVVGGYIRGSSVLAGGSGATRRDNRRDQAPAGRAMLGGQLLISKHIGFTLGYDALVGKVENNTFTNHAVELGLRLTF